MSHWKLSFVKKWNINIKGHKCQPSNYGHLWDHCDIILLKKKKVPLPKVSCIIANCSQGGEKDVCVAIPQNLILQNVFISIYNYVILIAHIVGLVCWYILHVLRQP